jgi:hypothetical protein
MRGAIASCRKHVPQRFNQVRMVLVDASDKYPRKSIGDLVE